MEIRLLGAIEACEDGIPLPLGGPRQRAVLADLALHAGRVVSTDPADRRPVGRPAARLGETHRWRATSTGCAMS